MEWLPNTIPGSQMARFTIHTLHLACVQYTPGALRDFALCLSLSLCLSPPLSQSPSSTPYLLMLPVPFPLWIFILPTHY